MSPTRAIDSLGTGLFSPADAATSACATASYAVIISKCIRFDESRRGDIEPQNIESWTAGSAGSAAAAPPRSTSAAATGTRRYPVSGDSAAAADAAGSAAAADTTRAAVTATATDK